MAQRTTADTLVLPLKLFAVLAIGGFLFWLYSNAEPTEIAVDEEVEEPAADTFIDALLQNPMFFEDERIRLTGVTVGDRLGLNAFWASDPTGQQVNDDVDDPEDAEEAQLLVRIPRQLVDEGVGVGEGQQALVTGFLHMMSDSVLDAWEADGVFDSDEDRERVAEEEYFVEADGVTSVDAEPAEDENTDPAQN